MHRFDPTQNDGEHESEHFADLDLTRIDLVGHVFEDCSFERCDLKSADLTRTRFLSCSFETCDLSNAKLGNARVRDSRFTNCKLIGLQWASLEDLLNPFYEKSNLDYGNFVALKLKKAFFSECSLRDVDFSQTDLTEANLRGSNLLGARFNHTSLLKADLRGATNYLIDPVENKVRGAKFSLPDAQGLLAGLGVVIEN